MKKARRILSVLMCALLLMGTMTVSAFADSTGSITIKNPSNSQATVAGKTFNVYKIFDAKTNGDNISYSWHNDDFIEFFKGFTGNTTSQSAVDYMTEHYTDNALALSQFAEDLHKYINAKSIPPFTTKTVGDTNATSTTIDGLTYGYYMVYDSSTLGDSAVRSAIMLTSVNKDVEVTLKANRPQIEKTVKGNDGNFGEGTSSSIGDTVVFKVETIIPSHTMYTNYIYKIEDKIPAGLTFNEGSVKVYKNDTVVTSGYDVSYAEKVLTVDLHTDETFKAGEKISITYDVTVNKDAVKHIINTAKLIYSNDPTNDGVNGTTGNVTDTANVYSYQLILSKFAQDTNGNFMNKRLAGAEFKLYKENSTEPIKFSAVTEKNDDHEFTKYIVDPNGTVDTLVVCKDGDETITIEHLNYGGHLGDITIFGLAEGTYKLEEIKAPDGYVLPDSPFYITITDSIGILGSVGTLDVTGSHTGTGSIVNTNGMAENILTVWAEITNKPGSTLPETGGMGTTLFTVLGIILMAGAVSYVFMKRKRTA